jgi:hypothetical protein
VSHLRASFSIVAVVLTAAEASRAQTSFATSPATAREVVLVEPAIEASQPPAVAPVEPKAETKQEPAKGSKLLDEKAVEKIVADALKKKDDDKKKADEKKAEEKKAEDKAKKAEELFGGTRFDLQTLYDSLHMPNLDEPSKKWYDKLQIRGYTQFRFGRTLDQDPAGAEPNLLGDRTINGNAENFLIRRARLILFGDVSDHFYLYFQPDFASTPQGATQSTFFAQLRDLYADVYIDKTKIHRFRVGLSKVPYGFENMQSSQNRGPLDRTDALNTGVAPNERDLGVFYYWTPEDKQKLFSTLVASGLKGSGNYGVFGFGVYNGQGGSVFEQNLNLHTVARVTCPWQLCSGQVVEASLQGYIGEYTVPGSTIRALGVGPAITPGGTGRAGPIRDQRVAATFVWYPQPIGFQAEWQVGRGPGLNGAQTAVEDRALDGGYVMAMYRHETQCYGVVTPYCRWQQYTGGYRHLANAPYGDQRQLDLGLEWQMRKEMELVMEYSIVNTPNFTAQANGLSYADFEGSVLRFQFQVNY